MPSRALIHTSDSAMIVRTVLVYRSTMYVFLAVDGARRASALWGVIVARCCTAAAIPATRPLPALATGRGDAVREPRATAKLPFRLLPLEGVPRLCPVHFPQPGRYYGPLGGCGARWGGTAGRSRAGAACAGYRSPAEGVSKAHVAALAVNFQEVVHSVLAGDSGGLTCATGVNTQIAHEPLEALLVLVRLFFQRVKSPMWRSSRSRRAQASEVFITASSMRTGKRTTCLRSRSSARALVQPSGSFDSACGNEI
jgi:hypothetical protein